MPLAENFAFSTSTGASIAFEQSSANALSANPFAEKRNIGCAYLYNRKKNRRSQRAKKLTAPWLDCARLFFAAQTSETERA